MENKLYKQLINFNYTIFSNNELLAKIISDEKFRNDVILNINGIMFLEKNQSANIDDIQFGKSIGRALVKLLNEKISFSISSLTEDKIEEELIFFSTTIANTFGYSKDTMFDTNKIIKEEEFIEFVKNYKDNLNESDNQTTIQDESTIQINTVNAGEANNINVKNNSNNNQNYQQQPNQQNGQLFQNPMVNENFYPFKTKPKEMRWIKFIFAGTLTLIGIMFIVIYALLASQQVKVMNDDKAFALFWESKQSDFSVDSDNMKKAYADYFQRNWIMTPYTLIAKDPRLSTGVGAFSIILNVVMILILFSSVYPMLKQPKFYKDQYHVNGGTLFFFGFIILIFLLPILFNSSGGMVSMIFYLGFKDSDTSVIAENFAKWLFTADYLKDNNNMALFAAAISEQMNLETLRILSIIIITLMFVFLAMYIAIIFINPKIDREKYRLFIIEIQKKAMAQMQGKQYEMDSSLFESDEEMAAWNEKKGKSKK